MNNKVKEATKTPEGLGAMIRFHERSYGNVVNSEEAIAHLEEVFSNKDEENGKNEEK